MSQEGYSVSEEAFSFSAFPAKFGPSVLAFMFAVVILAAGRLAAHHHVLQALLIAALAPLIPAVAGRWILNAGVSSLKWMRADSKNLVAVRSEAPTVWLVAHIDSKSQTIPMLVRVGAVVLSSIMYLLAVITLVLRFEAAATIATLLMTIPLLPIIVCFIGNNSNGALDNATGVAAVLDAAGRVNEKVGILITSGEELGLAGARAFAGAHPQNGIALNCDTIDDAGRFLIMSSAPPARAAHSLQAAAKPHGVHASVRRMIPGILADNVAFSAAGWDSCTLSKGNLRTLARVHTSGDRSTSITGTGIAQAALILAAAAEELT